ncbi:hemolysin [Acinetobacter sp. Ag2]|uniref:I78 family peptidase inhibitor n=1 Tax=Acinetobacter sp. Ag2 TaxID=1646532 RepID=UPI00062974C5|nr:I78 family peptidase inhibitor [Acinetobacter sp. Ag2]KKW81426.1 hemolysin [Acinetobacter sp. Ag2]
MKNVAIIGLGIASLAISACSSIQTNAAQDQSAQNMQSTCIAERATQLIGQNDMSEAKIKQLTQATIVRKVAPNQGVTMDYRVERVTITVDPVTKKITQASCG